jgi:hypothetical protein
LGTVTLTPSQRETLKLPMGMGVWRGEGATRAPHASLASGVASPPRSIS